jgi:hypothetical protein
MELHPNNWDESESNLENIMKSLSMTNHFRDLKVLHLVLQCLFFENVALSAYHYTNDNLVTAQKSFFLVPVSFVVDFTAHNCTYAT